MNDEIQNQNIINQLLHENSSLYKSDIDRIREITQKNEKDIAVLKKDLENLRNEIAKHYISAKQFLYWVVVIGTGVIGATTAIIALLIENRIL